MNRLVNQPKQRRTNHQIGTEADNVIRMLEQNSDRLETVIRRVTSTDNQNNSTAQVQMLSEFTNSANSSNTKPKKRVSWSPSPPRKYSFFEDEMEINNITPESSVELDQVPYESDREDRLDKFTISNQAGPSASTSSLNNSRSNLPRLLSGTFKSHHLARIAVSQYFFSQKQKQTITRTAARLSDNTIANEVIVCHLSMQAISKVGKLKSSTQRDHLAKLEELKKQGKDAKFCDFEVQIGPVYSNNPNGDWEVKKISGRHYNHDNINDIGYIRPQKPLPIGKYRTQREIQQEKEEKKLAEEKKKKGKGKANLKRASGREDSNEGEESQQIPPRKKHRSNSTSITQSQPPSNSTSTATLRLSKSDTAITNPTSAQPLTFTQFESFLIGIQSSAKLFSFSKVLYEKLELTNTQALINLLVMDRQVVGRILKDLGMRSDEREILLGVVSS